MSGLEKISAAIVSLATVGAFAAYSSAALELNAVGQVAPGMLGDLPTHKAVGAQPASPAARPLPTQTVAPAVVVKAPPPAAEVKAAPEPAPVPLLAKTEPSPPRSSPRPRPKANIVEKTVAAATPASPSTASVSTPEAPPVAAVPPPVEASATSPEPAAPPPAKAEQDSASATGAPSPASDGAATTDAANAKHRRARNGSDDGSAAETGSRDEWGTLALKANAAGDAFVDGHKVKKTQLSAFKVAPGSHTVRFDCVGSDGSKKTGPDKAVDVLPYSEVSVDFECGEQGGDKPRPDKSTNGPD